MRIRSKMIGVKSIGAIAVLAVAALGMSQVAAHHSATMYDVMRSEVLKGKIVEVRWVNPHVSLTVHGTIKSGEAASHWLIETTSPGNLIRVGGWQRDTLKPGEAVEVVFHPLREPGKKLGLLRQVTTLSNGQVYAASIRDVETADLE